MKEKEIVYSKAWYSKAWVIFIFIFIFFFFFKLYIMHAFHAYTSLICWQGSWYDVRHEKKRQKNKEAGLKVRRY